MRKLWVSTLVFLVLPAVSGLGQAQVVPAIYGLIDAPTALSVDRGAYGLETRLQPEGGILGSFRVGLTDHLSLGFSYGGFGIVGSGLPDWNPKVEFRGAYQLLEENVATPALALGYDSQGYGLYLKDLERYETKSKGFYAAATKSYSFLATLVLHGGANYSLEGRKRNKTVDFWTGVELGIDPELSALAEYDFGLNDRREEGGMGRGKGYLNAGLRFRYTDNLVLEADFRDLLENAGEGSTNRVLKIGFGEAF